MSHTFPSNNPCTPTTTIIALKEGMDGTYKPQTFSTHTHKSMETGFPGTFESLVVNRITEDLWEFGLVVVYCWTFSALGNECSFT